MHEPDVVLTDYLLASSGFLFAGLLHLRGLTARPIFFWFAVYFIVAGIASACGGTVHGFLQDTPGPAAAILWRIAMLAAGAASLTNWAIGSHLVFSPRVTRIVIALAAIQLAAFSLYVIFVNQNFLAVIAVNLPAVLFLLVALVVAYARQPRGGLLVVAAGLSLTLVAAAVQQSGLDLHPHFTHNALFHATQTVALAVMFAGCRLLAMRPANETDPQPIPAAN